MNTLVKYRKINLGSNVDESLFGTRTKSSSRANNDTKSVMISSDELHQIRLRAALVNEADIEAKRRAHELREAKEKKSQERKDHMRRLEAEKIHPKHKTETELLNQRRDQAIRKQAEEQLDGNSDVVKLLNSLSSRAIAFTIRDKQLEEKHRRSLVEDEYNRRMDMIMELDRLKDLKHREELEAGKAYKRVEDRKTVTVQMEEKLHARLLEQEAKEQENMAMRALMKKYERDEEELARKRQEHIEQSKKEIILANDDAIRRKLEAKERGKKDVEEALLYMALKDEEMARREQEERDRELKKKEAQAKLLAQQERVQSNIGKLDELRARRAEEERERAARKKERDEAQKRKADLQVLQESREMQAQHKRQQEVREKARDEEEYLHSLDYIRTMAEREKAEDDRKRAMAEKCRRDLEVQMRADQERRRMNRVNNYEDGSRVKSEMRLEEERLRGVRDKMVRDLEAKGVNPKYLGELRTVDVGKYLRR